MTKHEGKAEVMDIKGLLAQDESFVRAARCCKPCSRRRWSKAIGTEKSERPETRPHRRGCVR
jgi:hypothetical protein